MKTHYSKLNLTVKTLLILALAGCSVHAGTGSNSGDEGGASVSAESLSYDFKVDNYCQGMCTDPESNEHCETSHSFDSQGEYCNGLEDVTLNNGCARSDREQRYTADCGNDFHDVN